MNCPNTIRDTERECGDEGEMCAECFDKERRYWSRHFGQDHGTRGEKRARLAAMCPPGLEDRVPEDWR